MALNNNNDFKIDFIGIGAQKAATSWISKCLSEHPDIFISPSKETHFFSDDNLFKKGLSFYKTFFNEHSNYKIIGEYSTSYLSDKNSPLRIKDEFPNVKIIVSLRNPADRAFSHFLHLKSKGEVSDKTSLKEAIDKFPEIIKNGMYGEYLNNYIKIFSKENILILFYEDIKKNPYKTIKNTYKFLEVENNFIPNGISGKYNTSAARLSPMHNKINKLYFFLKRSKAGRFVIKLIRFFGINSFTMYNILNKFSRRNTDINLNDKKYLQNIYKNDIEKLEKLINKDLNFWKN